MLFRDTIRRKRDGEELSADELSFFVAGLADASIPAEQVSALAMAVCLNGMSFEEAATLTLDMANSGTVLNWSQSGLSGPVVDKHSTGGVGDKVSFMLAPIAAACGCFVPMISGRGLGHTGGTTDKIESIPGYCSMPDFDRFRDVVSSVGCAIIGQTDTLAPADKRLYAIRDVTATVESVPLITASILSKKIAAGLDGLVMDIKIGTGAFMQTQERAAELAKSIIGTAASAGLKTHALLTDMNQVLGHTAGNALEIRESVQYLRNEHREERLDEATLSLCAEMLIITGLETDQDTARRKVEHAVTSGAAAEKFSRMIAALGGPANFVDSYDKHLPSAPIVWPVNANADGILTDVNVRKVGNAIIELGGGRHVLGEPLDLSVGLTDIAPLGTTVDKDTPLAVIHASNADTAELAADMIRDACTVGTEAAPAHPVIYETITA